MMGTISSNSTYIGSLLNENEKTWRFVLTRGNASLITVIMSWFPSIFQITGISIKGKLSLAKLNRHFKFKTAQRIFRVLITCASFSPWIRYNLLINSRYTVVTVPPQRSYVHLSLILPWPFELRIGKKISVMYQHQKRLQFLQNTLLILTSFPI